MRCDSKYSRVLCQTTVMIPFEAPLFDLVECNSEQEKEFIEILHNRAKIGGWTADSWPAEDRIILSVDISDPDPAYRVILRTLRIDFDGMTTWLGPDETFQLVTNLNPDHPDVTVLSGISIFEAATRAADWLEKEIWRSIVRQEWDHLDERGVAPRLWIVLDTGEAFCSQGQRTTAMGQPERVIPVPSDFF